MLEDVRGTSISDLAMYLKLSQALQSMIDKYCNLDSFDTSEKNKAQAPNGRLLLVKKSLVTFEADKMLNNTLGMEQSSIITIGVFNDLKF